MSQATPCPNLPRCQAVLDCAEAYHLAGCFEATLGLPSSAVLEAANNYSRALAAAPALGKICGTCVRKSSG